MKAKTTTFSYASIVPLIGGETIGCEIAFKARPKYILSYKAFEAHDKQLLHHYDNEVPYHLIDNESDLELPYVDVVNAVCPCGGLSSLNPKAAHDNTSNDWMIRSAKYVLGKLKPRVFWGENAPRLSSKTGEPIVEQLKQIAEQEGYTVTLYKTKSILHGLSQVRNRTFYFFWREDNKVPVLNYYNRAHEMIEDTIRNTHTYSCDTMNVCVSQKKPSEDPYYRYILEHLNNGIKHKEFQEMIPKTTTTLDYIENTGITYDEVATWMSKEGYQSEADKCLYRYNKLKSGGNIFRKTTTIPKGSISAFVGHLPTMLTHPDQDRYLTVRECLSIMKMPSDFNLQGGLRNLNMICQNVPVTTAVDMSESILDYLNGKLQMVSAKFVIQNNNNKTIQ